jgi:plastocyanin
VRKLVIVASLSVTLVALGAMAVLTSISSAASQDGPTLRLVAGLGRGVVTVNEYAGDPEFPVSGTVRVAEGTTVVWNLGSDEPHTVTFRAGRPWPPVFMAQPEDPSRPPMLNPDLLMPTLPNGPWDGTTFIHMELQSPTDDLRITFSRPGRYRYSCLFHEEMDGYVEVVPAGTAGLTTQATIDTWVATHFDEEHAEYVTSMQTSRSVPARVEGPGGTNIWFVRAGTNDRRGHVDIQAFLPDALTISPGDTVVWTVDHVAPHTVTFPAADGSHPEFVGIQLPDGRVVPPPAPDQPPPPEVLAALSDPANPPRFVVLGAVPSRPSPVYDGQSIYSSGLIGEHPLVAYPMQKSWALTFQTPGVYHYECLLHESIGMEATITVSPR